MSKLSVLIAMAATLCASVALSQPTDPLPSWNDGPAKQAILDFVTQVTTEGDHFVPPTERIAVFDNDGTLWCEKPIYPQLAFAVDRVRGLSPQHAEWANQQPFKAVLEKDRKALLALGKQGLMQLVMATHAGMTVDEFSDQASNWLESARHPRFQRPYSKLIYQPMLELLDYLREHEFKTYIVSGGGIEMLRVFAQDVYGIPPEQVIGSSIKTSYEERDGVPTIVRVQEIDFIDDKAGKPVAIQKFIGRRPIAAFGNSDGDYEMLRYTTAGDGPRLGMIIRHTDAEREYAYDRDSHVGRLDRALDEADKRGWTVIDMQQDWQTVFPAP